MKKLWFKSALYFILILLTLEFFVRVFSLGKDSPSRYVDEFNVEKWIPNQEGFSLTGNRRQNFSEYHINNFGYNSYREFNPSYEKQEIALVGDSFIEGFHQDYYNSIGKKTEKKLNNFEVYEFGYAGYDFADQLHLIHAYQDMFDKIDYVVLCFRFKDDLLRGEYKVIHDRMRLESTLYKNARKSKLLVYAQSIGVIEAVKTFFSKVFSLFKNDDDDDTTKKKLSEDNIEEKHLRFIHNFKSLVSRYGYDKIKFKLLLDASETPKVFLEYLTANNYKYIDFGKSFNASKTPPTLIYDQHWNNHGRELVSDAIVESLKR